MNKKYYAYYSSPIGYIEIMTSQDLLYSVDFIDQIKEETSKPKILKETLKQLDEYFKGTRKQFDLNCQFEGTVFQNQVWKALMEIPYGQTMSYEDIAVKINHEKASRAVGNANNKNPIGIIVPCHRVIGSDKSLTGYAAGIDRKRWLLEHEKAL